MVGVSEGAKAPGNAIITQSPSIVHSHESGKKTGVAAAVVLDLVEDTDEIDLEVVR